MIIIFFVLGIGLGDVFSDNNSQQALTYNPLYILLKDEGTCFIIVED